LQGDLDKNIKISEKKILVRKIIKKIFNIKDIDEIKNYIITSIGKTLNATRCFIGEYHFDKDRNPIIKNQYLSSSEIKNFSGFIKKNKLIEASFHEELVISDVEKFLKENHFDENSEIFQELNNYNVKSCFSIPVDYNNNFSEVLVVHFDKAYAFNDEDISFVRTVADHVGIAINQCNLYVSLEKRMEIEKLLRSLITTVRSTIDLDKMLTIICDEVGKTFNADRASIIQCNDEKDFTNWSLKREYTAFETVKTHKQVNIDKGISLFWVEMLYKRGNKSYYIENVPETTLPEPINSSYKKLEVKTMLGISIEKDDDKWGGLFLSKTRSYDKWTKEEIKLLEDISDQIFTAIKQAELYKKVQETAKREKLIRETILSLLSSVSSLNIKEVFKAIVTEIGKLFEADRCFFAEYDADNNTMFPQDDYKEYNSDKTIKPAYSRKNKKEELAELIEIVIHQKQIIKVENTAEVNFPEETKKLLDDLSIKSFVGLPIFLGEMPLGTLVLHYVKDCKQFSRNEIDTLHTIATQSGIIINQAKLYKKVQKTAKEEKMLAEIMAVIKSNLKIDEIFMIICGLLANFYDVNRIIISKLDTKENNLNILNEYCKKDKNKHELSLKSKNYFYETIIKNKNLIINNVEKANNPKYFLKDIALMNIKALMMVPVYINENETGAIILQDNKKNNWQSEDVNFLLRIADYISIAIKESNLYNQSEFISNAAHELKTPLSIINGYAGALLNLEKPYCETTNRFLHIIKNNTERLNKLIDNLLFISTIEKKLDNEILTFEELKVADLIENSIQLCDEKIKLKKIKIEKNVKNLVIKRANTILLQQLIINLITNAVNSSEEHSIISLKTIKNNKEILISIEDNGCGIKKEHLPNIFERFYRIDKSRSRETGGTGLGLSISKLISEIHGGYITVESVFGKGSIFVLHLPE